MKSDKKSIQSKVIKRKVKVDLRFKFFKFVGWAYFPIQFGIVWIVFFGLEIQPDLIQLYEGFGLGGIIKAFWAFVAIIPVKAITAAKIVFFVINLIPYLVMLVLACWRIFIFLYAFSEFAQFIWAECKYNSLFKTIPSEPATAYVEAGPPGSGKSRVGSFKAYICALANWRKLRLKHWLYRGQLSKFKRRKQTQKLKEWEEIKASYDFVKAHPDKIPLLWSNIPIKDVKGRTANNIGVDYLYQNKRLPFCAVAFYDEVGSDLNADQFRKRTDEDAQSFSVMRAADFIRWCGHFLGRDVKIIMCEQRQDNILIDVRGCVSYNQCFDNHYEVCNPLLLKIAVVFYTAMVTHIGILSRPLSRSVQWLDDLVRSIGYTKFTYHYIDNSEGNCSMFENDKTCSLYLSHSIPMRYDTRAYRDFYQAKEMPLEYTESKSMIINPIDENGNNVYLRQREARLAHEMELQAQEEARERIISEYVDALPSDDFKALKIKIAALDERDKVKSKLMTFSDLLPAATLAELAPNDEKQDERAEPQTPLP